MTVAGRCPLVHLAVDVDGDNGYWLEPLREVEGVVDYLHVLGDGLVLQHVGDDVGEVFGGDHLFFVAQLDHPLGNPLYRFFVELDAQRFEIFADVGPSRSLAQSILALAAEALGQQVVVVEVVLVVAVGMYPGALGEYRLADNGLVGGYPHARVGLDDAAHLVEHVFGDTRRSLHLVVQHGQYTGEGGVPGSFAQAVDGTVHPLYAGKGGREGVGRGQVVVVVGMKVEPQVGVAATHGPAIFQGLERVENAQRVGQHEPLYGFVLQLVDQLVDILRRVLYAVRPVLEVEVDFQSGFPRLSYGCLDVDDMLLYRLFELEGAVLLRAFAE